MLSYRVYLMCRLQPMWQRQWSTNGSVKNETTIVEHEGKSAVWKLFGTVERGHKLITNFLACMACKKFYAFKSCDGTRTHSCDEGTSGPVAKSMSKKGTGKDFDWGAAGFSKHTKVIPAAAKTDLNGTPVIAAAMDFRPLGMLQAMDSNC